MSDAATPLTGRELRRAAHDLAAPFPPLLAEAEHLAATVVLGEHGRRRAGLGDTFWQFRPAQDHDELRDIDWRRSAMSDGQFVRQKEWQVAQTVVFWVDRAASMHFTSLKDGPTKAERAAVLAIALGSLLLRSGERVGMTAPALRAAGNRGHLTRMAELLSDADAQDYGTPSATGMASHGRAVFISDFMGDIGPAEAALARAADRDVRGVLLQVLDPQEEAFPFDGRTIFESMGGGLVHETLKAGDLRDRYLTRLAERKDRLESLAREAGWQFTTHHTGQSASAALLWAYQALERRV